MSKIENVEKSLEIIEKKFNESNLAIEMMRELKQSSKRWFISFILTLIALIMTNVGWMIYESQFENVEETTTIDGGNGMTTYLENSEGDIIWEK